MVLAILGFVFLLLCAAGILILGLATQGSTEVRSVALDKGVLEELRKDVGYTACFERGFFASSHNGFNGDGKAVHVFTFDPANSANVCESLFSLHPELEWSEESANYSLIGLADLLPGDFQPDTDTKHIHGRPAEGFPSPQFFVDRKRGLYFKLEITH